VGRGDRPAITHRPAGGPIPHEVEPIISELQDVLTENAEDYGRIIRQGSGDVVPDLLSLLRWQPPQPTVRVEEVAPSEPDIRKRVVKQWKTVGKRAWA